MRERSLAHAGRLAPLGAGRRGHGRHAGHLALWSGLAGGAYITLIPEAPFEIEKVLKLLDERLSKGKKDRRLPRYAVVVVAEGALPAGGGEVTLSRRWTRSATRAWAASARGFRSRSGRKTPWDSRARWRSTIRSGAPSHNQSHHGWPVGSAVSVSEGDISKRWLLGARGMAQARAPSACRAWNCRGAQPPSTSSATTNSEALPRRRAPCSTDGRRKVSHKTRSGTAAHPTPSTLIQYHLGLLPDGQAPQFSNISNLGAAGAGVDVNNVKTWLSAASIDTATANDTELRPAGRRAPRRRCWPCSATRRRHSTSRARCTPSIAGRSGTSECVHFADDKARPACRTKSNLRHPRARPSGGSRVAPRFWGARRS